MPTPQDLIYDEAFKRLNKLGFAQRDCEEGGAEAVRMYRRNVKAFDAIERAIQQKKKAKKSCA